MVGVEPDLLHRLHLPEVLLQPPQAEVGDVVLLQGRLEERSSCSAGPSCGTSAGGSRPSGVATRHPRSSSAGCASCARSGSGTRRTCSGRRRVAVRRRIAAGVGVVVVARSTATTTASAPTVCSAAPTGSASTSTARRPEENQL